MDIRSRLSYWSASSRLKAIHQRIMKNSRKPLKSYLCSRDYKDKSSTQTLTASGLTIIQAILKIMQDDGRKAQTLDNYPSLISVPETCRLRLELARQARKMDPDSWKKHFEETVSKRHPVAVAGCNYGPIFDWSDNHFTHTGGILNIRNYRRPPTRHKGIDYRLQVSAPGVTSINASISTLNTLFKITSTL